MVQKGDRIELVFTDDPYTQLKPGDRGTVRSVNTDPWGDLQIGVEWDSGSTLSLIDGKDRYMTWHEDP
jgi:hypothetical protein